MATTLGPMVDDSRGMPWLGPDVMVTMTSHGVTWVTNHTQNPSVIADGHINTKS